MKNMKKKNIFGFKIYLTLDPFLDQLFEQTSKEDSTGAPPRAMAELQIPWVAGFAILILYSKRRVSFPVEQANLSSSSQCTASSDTC